MENVRRASLYDCIGVAPDATRETIEHACRQAAERYRAGKDSGDPAATRAFAQIKMAYKTLTDPTQRADYDSSLAGLRPAPPAAPAAAAAATTYPLQFSATAGEYFRIWIVNLALTLLTLGIYSAWAKVRKKRYFYAHTRLAGEGFEYRGNPRAILKGRALAVGLLAIYSLAGHISPIVQGALGLVFAFLVPWLLVRSLAFNAYNSAYRNIRLHFGGTYRQALNLMGMTGLLTVITLGIAYPYAKARLTRFSAVHHRYGTAPFSLPSLTSKFYGIYLRLVGLTIVAFVLGGALAAGAMFLARPLLFAVAPVALVGLYLLWFSYPRARIGNALWNNLTIGDAAQVRFHSALRARDLASLYFVNVLVIAITLGLATPWAVVRTMRYRASKTSVEVSGGLDQFVAAQTTDVGASGEAVGEMFGFDFSF